MIFFNFNFQRGNKIIDDLLRKEKSDQHQNHKVITNRWQNNRMMYPKFWGKMIYCLAFHHLNTKSFAFCILGILGNTEKFCILQNCTLKLIGFVGEQTVVGDNLCIPITRALLTKIQTIIINILTHLKRHLSS